MVKLMYSTSASTLNTIYEYYNTSSANSIWWEGSSNSTSRIHISYDFDDYDDYDDFKLRHRIRLKENFVETTHLKEIVEERMEEFVYDNVDRYFIRDAGGNIDSWITEKGYDICAQVINQALNHEFEDDFDSEIDEDELSEILFNGINFDKIYEIIDDINNAPITFEEKLADVGMSIHDFI